MLVDCILLKEVKVAAGSERRRGAIMPWLVKGNPNPAENLLFVHVPRCGGTSLMQFFDVPKKAMEGRSCMGRFGLRVFFHRYKLLESANFPIWTHGNAFFAIIFVASIAIRFASTNEILRTIGRSMSVVSISFLLCLSFVFTAPVIGRFHRVRRMYLVFVHYILARAFESIEWCTGTNKTGYIMHLTAHKLLAYGYVTPEEMEQVSSMAIVRNPYSRMVSIYMYNRFGRHESFSHFLKSWHKLMYAYRTKGETEEWYTPCHAIPQFEFTHYEGKQLVQSIVKQEELKLLKTKEGKEIADIQDSSVSDLPDPVRNALLGMPHSNQRKTKEKWFDYYDQDTLNLTYELYKKDFVVFGYSPELEQRPDLKSPESFRLEAHIDTMQETHSVKRPLVIRETRRPMLRKSFSSIYVSPHSSLNFKKRE